jgi:serine/threonine protein kinase
MTQSHENITKLYEVIEDKEMHIIYLVMDFVMKGAILSTTYWASENFSTLGGAPKKISIEKAKKYFRQLVQAVHYRSLS